MGPAAHFITSIQLAVFLRNLALLDRRAAICIHLHYRYGFVEPRPFSSGAIQMLCESLIEVMRDTDIPTVILAL
jgi:hypothetical protein